MLVVCKPYASAYYKWLKFYQEGANIQKRQKRKAFSHYRGNKEQQRKRQKTGKKSKEGFVERIRSLNENPEKCKHYWKPRTSQEHTLAAIFVPKPIY